MMEQNRFEMMLDVNPELAMWLQEMEYRLEQTTSSGRPSKNQPYLEMSTKRHVHLIAMRCMRNLDRKRMSYRSGIPYCVLEYFETARDALIPRYVEIIYINTLKLTKVELKKVDEIISGERTNLEDEKRREIPAGIRRKVMKRDKRRCVECGNKHFLHFHHVKHFSRGGAHTEENIKLLCVACHAKAHKNDKSFHMLKKLALELMGVVV